MTLSRISHKAISAIALLVLVLCFSIPASRATEFTDVFVDPIDLTRLSGAGRESVNLTLSAGARDYDLRLVRSSAMASIGNESQQFYEGKVTQDESSWVRLSYINGVLSGHIKAWGELLEIRSDDTDSTRYTLKSVSARALQISAGIDATLKAPPTPGTSANDVFLDAVSRISYRAGNPSDVTRVMRVGIVVDSRFNEVYGGKGLSKALSIINSVDGLYQEQFGLAIRLESSLLLDSQNDPFLPLDGNIETVLREFRAYTLENDTMPADAGVLHLFTGSYDDNQIIGLSWIDTVCRTDGYNVSVSTPFAHQMLLAAHEIGHNLGAVHDDSASCEVELNKVMWPKISDATSSEFSNCSKNTIIPKLSASCNLDNIDMSLSMKGAREANSDTIHTLSIGAANTDKSRTASRVKSVTTFPQDVIPANVPNRCSYFADTLTCDHGNIKASSENTVTISVESTATSSARITSELLIDDFADINTLNNTATVEIESDSSAPDENNAADEDNNQDQSDSEPELR